MIVIKNCPFCNFPDVEIDETAPGEYAVCCPECETIGPVAYDVNDSIKRWNTREAQA